MYFYVKNDSNPADVESPVFAPANIVIDSIGYRHFDRQGNKTNYLNYTLTFSVCDGLAMYFHNVRSLTHPSLLALRTPSCVPQGSGIERFCQVRVNVPIKAGEQVGTTGDTEANVGGLDLGARDYRLTTGRSAFANPDRWCAATGFQNIYDPCYTVCPLDYLPASERSQFVDLFADFTRTVVRTEEPKCGTAYSDVPGAAQGRWFGPGGTRASEGLNLYLGPSAFTSQLQVFSMGTSVPGIRPGAYVYQPRDTGLVNRRFRDVADGQVHCFESLYQREADARAGRNPYQGITVLIQVIDSGQSVRIEPRQTTTCGAGPWSLTSTAVTFQR